MALNNSDKRYTNHTYKISEVVSNAIVNNIDIHADCEQDALDILADSKYSSMIVVDDEESDIRFGNTGKPCNLDTITIECLR